MDRFHLSVNKSGGNYQTTLLFHKIRQFQKINNFRINALNL